MSTPNRFRGSFAALITPFRGGAVDEEAFTNLVEWQIRSGTHGLVPGGTTGEAPTLGHAEHRRVISLCVEAARGRIPVVAGTGSNSTSEAIELTRYAGEAGADAALIVNPYYNKPSQEGLYRHFRAVHDATDIPIILYNIPARCVIDVSTETLARLAELPRIIGIKDSTTNLARPLLASLAIRKPFAQFSGDDATSGAFLAQGGHGCISVAANVAPAHCARFQDAWRDGDLATFQALNLALTPLRELLSAEPSPGPVKYAASLLGLCAPEIRLPLCEPGEALKERLRRCLSELGLLN